jgi:hypothetical protein
MADFTLCYGFDCCSIRVGHDQLTVIRDTNRP